MSFAVKRRRRQGRSRRIRVIRGWSCAVDDLRVGRTARLAPKPAGDLHWVDASITPEGVFVAATMQDAVMDAAERYRKFIAHLAAERGRLRETDVVRIARFASADEARLLGDEPEVVPVAQSPRLAEGEGALVDFASFLVSVGHRYFANSIGFE